jgi:hypothetical protein
MRRTKQLTVSAALTALIVVLLYLGSLVEVLDLVTIFLAALFIAFAVIELGRWKWMVYAASALLAILLLPNKFVAWEYALVGVLTILKSYLERLTSLVQWVLKLVSFNILYGGMLALFFFLFGMALTPLTVFSFTIPAYLFPAVLFVLGNLCYLLYDFCMTRMITFYFIKYSDRVRRWLR